MKLLHFCVITVILSSHFFTIKIKADDKKEAKLICKQETAIHKNPSTNKKEQLLMSKEDIFGFSSESSACFYVGSNISVDYLKQNIFLSKKQIGHVRWNFNQSSCVCIQIFGKSFAHFVYNSNCPTTGYYICTKKTRKYHFLAKKMKKRESLHRRIIRQALTCRVNRGLITNGKTTETRNEISTNDSYEFTCDPGYLPSHMPGPIVVYCNQNGRLSTRRTGPVALQSCEFDEEYEEPANLSTIIIIVFVSLAGAMVLAVIAVLCLKDKRKENKRRAAAAELALYEYNQGPLQMYNYGV